MVSRLFILWILVSSLGFLAAESAIDNRQGAEVLERFLLHANGQREALRNVSMEVDIEADLPQLKKTGKLNALRHVSKLGKVSYEVLSFIGDNMVKKDIIARYMAAEVKSSGNGNRSSMVMNRANYSFKYWGLYGDGDWRLHLFELKPRRKRLGLFRGWLWVEATTGLPVRESGRFVKNPSVFLKRVEFMRDYRIGDGLAVPVRIESTIQTRLIGKAELRVSFHDYSFHEPPAKLAAQGIASPH